MSAPDPSLPFDNQFCCDAQRGAILLRDRSLAALFRFQIGRFDHSSPFLGLLGEVLSKFGGRSNKGKGAQLRKSGLQLCVGEASIDLPVQLIDNLGARVSWSANAVPGARLVTR